jgi:hypothetical protein
MRKNKILFVVITLFLVTAAAVFMSLTKNSGVIEQSSNALSFEEFENAPTKNICSITINSDDELIAFKQNLARNKQFSFTEFIKDDKDWFNDACKTSVPCDVLIISGHFGGTFFGKTNQHLSLSELEAKGCAQSCKNILSTPKEIYLFGCNTLSTKDPDSRTPEQYLQVLLEDGLERSFAERVVEARYGPSGEENLNRMKRAFPGVPVIYGFCQKAPLGPEAGPIIRKYLGQAKDYYAHLVSLQIVKDTKQPYSAETLKQINNDKLGAMFKAVGRCFRQTPGVDTNDEISNRVCSVRNVHNSIEARAEDLNFLMNTPQNLSYIELCNDFLTELKNKNLNSSEQAAVNLVKNNKKLREDIENVLSRVSLFLAFDYAALAIELGSDRSKVSSIISGYFVKLLKKGLTREELNYLVSLSYRMNFKDFLQIDYNMIDDPKVWGNANALQVIGLTETTDKAIHNKLRELIKSVSVANREQLLDAIVKLKAFDESLREYVLPMLYDNVANVRASAIRILTEMPKYDEKTVNEVIAVVGREIKPIGATSYTVDQNWVLKKALVYFFYNSFDTAVIRAHLINSLSHDYFEVRQWSAMTLQNYQLREAYEIDGLVSCLSKETHASVQAYCRSTLRINRHNIALAVAEKLKIDMPNEYQFIFNNN